MKTSLFKDAELAFPIATHTFNTTVDASIIGPGAKLFLFNCNSTPIIKCKLYLVTPVFLEFNKKKLSTSERELCAITFALSQYDFNTLALNSHSLSSQTIILFSFPSPGTETSHKDNMELNCY